MDTAPALPPQVNIPPPQTARPIDEMSNVLGPKKRFTFLKIIFFILVGILSFLILSGGAVYAIAYEKIDINNPKLQKQISQVVMNLPFAPKTPRFLLESTILAHKKLSSHSFDISIATKSNDVSALLGLNQIDAQIKGDIDYSDPKNIKLGLNADITKDFSLELKKKDPTIYLKVNKIPALILSFLGIEEEKLKPIFENWIAFDTKPLDTEARRQLDQEVEPNLTEQYIVETVDGLLDEKLLKEVKVTKETIDGFSSYKLDLNTNQQTIDYLFARLQSGSRRDKGRVLLEGTTKPSDTIKELVAQVWVDEQKFYIRKILTSFKLSYDKSPVDSYLPTQVLGISKNVLGETESKKTDASFVSVIKFSDFGKKIEVHLPDKSMKVEEFYKLLASVVQKKYASASALLKGDDSTSRDVSRLSDLATIQQAINVAAQVSEDYEQIFCSKTGDICNGDSRGANSKNSDGSGWIKVNLQKQKAVSVPDLPLDPVNNSIHHYSYCAKNDGWEINAVLESEKSQQKMANDGGDEENKYEAGSNLNLIGKTPGCKY